MGNIYNFPQSRWCLYPGHSKKPIELNSLKTNKRTKLPHLETSIFLDGLEELSIAVYIETSVIYENERSQQNIINISQGLGSTADSVSPPNNNNMQSFNYEFGLLPLGKCYWPLHVKKKHLQVFGCLFCLVLTQIQQMSMTNYIYSDHAFHLTEE